MNTYELAFFEKFNFLWILTELHQVTLLL